MTQTKESTAGEILAEGLLQGVDNTALRAATRFLGAHQDGYWLRRFIEDQELAQAVNQPCSFIDRSGQHSVVDWTAVALVLVTQPWVLRCSSSEMIALEVASALAGKSNVNLGKAIDAFSENEFARMVQAINEARYDIV